MSNAPPPVMTERYNHELRGVYGEFGAGAGVHAFYLQSAIAPAQLNWVSLISDISGSERWPVRDLFQRDVDNSRVESELLPYLQDSDKIKFFNPLTLTVLPMKKHGTTVLGKMPQVNEYDREEAGRTWTYLEREPYYRVGWVADNPQYAVFQWNDTRSRLVAIDGQHRLSALKRFLRDERVASHPDFMEWRIPVVIVSFRAGRQSADSSSPSVLEVVRSIFVYINTEAKEVNEARKILLSDRSVNAVCTQELLERSHANDLLPKSQRDVGRVPLLFYDWRGEEQGTRQLHAPAAVKSVEEIRDWFRHYLLGLDFKDMQQTALGIDNPTHPLHEAFYDKKLSHADSRKLRELIGEEVLPAVEYLLEHFAPYRDYVARLRELERDFDGTGQSDVARHAFYELRFGANQADDTIRHDVAECLETIKDQIEGLKEDHLHSPIDLEIGMRGVLAACGLLRRRMGSPPWVEYSEWFTDALNRLYADGWLDLQERAAKRKFLRHIAEDHNDLIVNYRLDDAGDCLGAYVGVLALAYGRPWPEPVEEERPAMKEELLNRLQGTLLRGYRREVRPGLREEFPNGGKELTKAVNDKANRLTRRHLNKFEGELAKIEADGGG